MLQMISRGRGKGSIGNDVPKRSPRRYSIKISVWGGRGGGKIQFPLLIDYFTKRKNPEAENRVTGASSPPFPGQTMEKLKKPKVLSSKRGCPSQFPDEKSPPHSQNVTLRNKKEREKKEKNSNSFLSTEWTDIQKKTSSVTNPKVASKVKRTQCRSRKCEILFRGSRFPSVCVPHSTKCFWKSRCASVEKLSRIWQHCDVAGRLANTRRREGRGGHTETGAKNREWFYAAEVGGGTEPWPRKVPKGRVRLTEVVGQARHVTASGGDRAGGVGTRWAGPMVSPPLTTLATQDAGRLERSARGSEGGRGEGEGGGEGAVGMGTG